MNPATLDKEASTAYRSFCAIISGQERDNGNLLSVLSARCRTFQKNRMADSESKASKPSGLQLMIAVMKKNLLKLLF